MLGNSSGTFVAAWEDSTGVLDSVEEKIARVTMMPRNHGEVISDLAISLLVIQCAFYFVKILS